MAGRNTHYIDMGGTVQLTQQDYDERKQRVEDGTGDDEDRRLVKHYESEGFEWRGNSSQPSDETTQRKPDASEMNHPSTAPTTGNPSKTSEAGDSTAGSTAGAGRTGKSSTRSAPDSGK